jgi:hypothetical protein
MPGVHVSECDRGHLQSSESGADIDGYLLAIVTLGGGTLAWNVLLLESIAQIGHGSCGAQTALLANGIAASVD